MTEGVLIHFFYKSMALLRIGFCSDFPSYYHIGQIHQVSVVFAVAFTQLCLVGRNPRTPLDKHSPPVAQDRAKPKESHNSWIFP